MIISARQLAGKSLIGKNGDEVGLVREVVVERHRGKLVYALMQVPGASGDEGVELYPLPWAVLRFDPEDQRLHLKADPQHLQRAPNADVEGPVDWNDRLWGERLHEHYGLQPYWTLR